MCEDTLSIDSCWTSRKTSRMKFKRGTNTIFSGGRTPWLRAWAVDRTHGSATQNGDDTKYTGKTVYSFYCNGRPNGRIKRYRIGE